jgi:large subunit ribosomal protein L25
MLKDLQRHPYKPQILHADFQRIDDENAVIVYVPFHFTNEIACIGVKQDGGLISHRINGVKVSCSANDLPEYIEVDMADVHLGKILHLSDIVLPKGVRIRGLRKGSNNDLPVSTVVKLKGR